MNTINDNKNHEATLEFIINKTYIEAKDGLIEPSEVLVNVVSKMEIDYCNIIDDYIYSSCVKASLVLS